MSEFDKDVKLEMKGLEALQKALKQGIPTIRVGILGDSGKLNRYNKVTKTGRASKGSHVTASSNATVGAYHEYIGVGKAKTKRSFLRMPLIEKFEERLKRAGLASGGRAAKAAMNKVIKDKSFLPLMSWVAIVAYDTVMEAFKTGGFGMWKPSNMKRKKVQQTLVETQQLRRSITWKLITQGGS